MVFVLRVLAERSGCSWLVRRWMRRRWRTGNYARIASRSVLALVALLVFEPNALRAQPVDLAALNAEVDRLIDARQEQAALALGEKLVNHTIAQLGAGHWLVGMGFNKLALIYEGQKRFQDAEAAAKRSLAILETARGPQHPTVSMVLSNLARLYGLQDRDNEAETYYRQSLAISEKTSGSHPGSTAFILEGIAAICDKQARYAEAVSLYLRAIVLREGAVGQDASQLARTVDSLAGAYLQQGRLVEAEAAYVRALDINQRSDLQTEDVASALTGISNVYAVQGKLADAEALAVRALKIRERLLPAEALGIGESLGWLATVLRVMARYGEAEKYSQRALTIVEKALGPNHPDVASALSDQSELYTAMGRYDAAEPVQLRALAIREKSLGHSHPSVAVSLMNLAVIDGLRKAYTKAEQSAIRAHTNLVAAMGAEHVLVAGACDILGALHGLQGRWDEAEPFVRRAMTIREKTFGSEHPDYAVSLNHMAQLFVGQHRFNEADAMFKRSVSVSEKALGPAHPNTAISLAYYGSFLKSEGRITEAETVLAAALDATVRALGADHPTVVQFTVQLAELYGLQGRTTEAEKLFAKAGASKSVDLKQFPIYFATDRKRVEGSPRVEFGRERATGPITLGTVTVVVPPGAMSIPSTGSKIGKNAPPLLTEMRQLSIQPTKLSDPATMVRSARARLLAARSSLGQALVFVHGFNVSFDNAVRRAGQLAYDLNFDGPVFVFSWPSQEKTLSYIADRESAQLSADSLRTFLETVVAETKASRIHIIAHSMGNVTLAEAFQRMDAVRLRQLNLGELVLASPDLNPGHFERLSRQIEAHGAKSTIYAASSDRALSFSSWIHGASQLGYIPPGGPKSLVAGADLIDTTAVNSDVFSWNHDSYANSPAIVGDLRRLLKDGQRPPDVRTGELAKVPVDSGGTYWRYDRQPSGGVSNVRQ